MRRLFLNRFPEWAGSGAINVYAGNSLTELTDDGTYTKNTADSTWTLCGGARKMIDYMSAPPTCVGKRKLIYLPIIHTAADMGTLGASIRGKKLSALGRQGLMRNATVVEKMWEEIERVVAGLPLTRGTARVYQDGLPVCGHEQAIVSELAAAGSRNHRMLLQLEARGATLMGTESPELLVQEYQLATAAFASGTTLQKHSRL